MGLETLADPAQLRPWVDELGPQSLVFSLDMKQGRPLAASPAWCDRSPEAIVAAVVEAGIHRMIVLDLADVGENRGVGTLPLCRQLRSAHPQLELTAGGGVRRADDIRQLATAGCDAVLVASALHDGGLSAADVRQLEASLRC